MPKPTIKKGLKKKPLTFSIHKERWKDCQKCSLCENRKQVVFTRGTIPCDLLLIGEAPGHSEDVLGKPFVGPAGKLLDRMIEQAMEDINEKVTVAFTNLVGCIPMGDDGSKTGEPDEESIEACLPKVYEFVRLARPRGIMLVGKLPTEWLEVEKLEPYLKKEPHYPKMIRSIIHPAAILRADVTQQGLMVQRTIVELNDLLADIVVPF